MKKKTTKRKFLTALTLAFAMLLSCIMIPATENTANAAAKLTVTAPKTVTVGKTVKVKTNISCKFKSSNTKIATVSSKGTVKGKKAGVVKITATSKKYPTLKKTVKITVKKAGTAVPVSIVSAKYKGKVPRGAQSNKFGVELKVKYSDGTIKTINPLDIDDWYLDSYDDTNDYYILKYGKLSATVKVEQVKVDETASFPVYSDLTYTGSPVKKGQNINIEDVSGKLYFYDGHETDISDYFDDINQVYFMWENDYGGTYNAVLEYRFSYKGQILCVYMNLLFIVPFK